jgi:sugar/nucleoside kinase (ribokinase family)
MTAPDVLVVGNLVWEVSARVVRLPEPDPDLVRTFRSAIPFLRRVREDGGGSAANTGVLLAQAGRTVAAVGYAGNDAAGRNALRALQRKGIDARVTLAPGRGTKRNLILVPDEGTPRVLVHVPPRVAPPLAPGAVPAELLAGARILHLDRASAANAALAAAREGRPVTLDLHTDPYRTPARDRLEGLLPRLDILMISEAAARSRARRTNGPSNLDDVCAALADLGIPWVVVTRGELGAVACERGRPAFAVAAAPVASADLVDPTGAGDAFMAALIDSRLAGRSLDEGCRLGALAGAAACRRLGARP